MYKLSSGVSGEGCVINLDCIRIRRYLGLYTGCVLGEIANTLKTIEVSVTTADLKCSLMSADIVVVTAFWRSHQKTIRLSRTYDLNLRVCHYALRMLNRFFDWTKTGTNANGITIFLRQAGGCRLFTGWSCYWARCCSYWARCCSRFGGASCCRDRGRFGGACCWDWGCDCT